MTENTETVQGDIRDIVFLVKAKRLLNKSESVITVLDSTIPDFEMIVSTKLVRAGSEAFKDMMQFEQKLQRN